ncbi:EF-P 5-aminopentanol modification-associated protein YfmH [Oceanobacillus sp. FSL H7-0719]|uniref:EF-P 5-aminopentanol modification-associated protein YfmH n=1 Tax=Oceanobacillus sp. FSL H7-0719 TaxID=2954507 RepID=UPI00324E1C60
MNRNTYPEIDEVIYTKKLDNGLSVFLMPRNEMEKTYAIFSTDYGSIDQTFVPIGEKDMIDVPDGVAHFLEHKLFEKEDGDVFADFGKLGASANAFTSFTKTAYLFSATNHIEENVQTLIDFVQDPYFTEKTVEKEKGIIAQEIKMYDDQPDWQSFMGTIKALFKNHPVNIDIAGTVDSIMKITKDDLYTCYHTFYHPENMSLFIIGNMDAEKLSQLIEENQANKSFEPMAEVIRDFPEEPRDVAHAELEINMPVSIPKCTIGIKELSTTIEKTDFIRKELLTNMVLDHYFSKGGSFYQELYQAELIDSSFSYESNLDRSFGYTIIGGNTENPEEFAAKVKELLLSTNKLEINRDEFSRMKKKRIGQILRAMNSLEYIASKFTDYQKFGINFFEVIPTIEALTVEDANAFLREWIEENRLAVCTIKKG